MALRNSFQPGTKAEEMVSGRKLMREGEDELHVLDPFSEREKEDQLGASFVVPDPLILAEEHIPVMCPGEAIVCHAFAIVFLFSCERGISR